MANFHSRFEGGTEAKQTRKYEFLKVDFVVKHVHIVEFVHISRFVKFKPKKIRGQIFFKQEKMQQVE